MPRQYIGGGSLGPSSGFGHVAVFEPKHTRASVSQHWTPPVIAGQLFAQSESFVHEGTHFFGSGRSTGCVLPPDLQ